jgi:hypothetical protein
MQLALGYLERTGISALSFPGDPDGSGWQSPTRDISTVHRHSVLASKPPRLITDMRMQNSWFVRSETHDLRTGNAHDACNSRGDEQAAHGG